MNACLFSSFHGPKFRLLLSPKRYRISREMRAEFRKLETMKRSPGFAKEKLHNWWTYSTTFSIFLSNSWQLNEHFFFRPDLMVKKLRYYARFIVVCLLLKKMKLVRDLVRELAKHIDEYTATYEPDDQLEWSLVQSEIKSFIEADTVVNVLDSDSNSIVLSHR